MKLILMRCLIAVGLLYLWRDEIEVTKPGDHYQSYRLGNLHGSVFGVAIF